MIERVLVVVKPDGMVKGLAGSVLSRFEVSGLSLDGGRMVKVTRSLAEAHYAHLKDKLFFGELIRFLTGELHGGQDLVLALVFSGEEAVSRARAIAGATNPEQADPRSLRGSVGRVTTKGVFENVVHVSSDPAEGEREIKLWFSPEDLAKEVFPVKTINERRVWA